LTYLKPITSAGLYVLRARLAPQELGTETNLSPEKDLTKKHKQEKSGITHLLNKKYEVEGSIENLEGKLLAKATAMWDIV
jgi:hypothetical protein